MSVIIKRVWNQNKMVNIESLHGMAFQAEDGGHVFEISGVNDAGEAVPLSGTVAGVFMRPDRADIALTGTASGGVASVKLTDDCYAVPGRFGLTIFVTEDGKKTAVYAAVGTVSRTSGGGVAGDTPQSVVDLINAIAAAMATIPASYTDLMAAVAPTYSDQAVYPAGSYRWHGGMLYKNPNAIVTPETWTAAHWTAAVLGDDVGDLKSALSHVYYSAHLTDNLADPLKNTVGSINRDGTVDTSAAAYWVSDYIPLDANADYVFTNWADAKARTSRKYVALYDASKTLISESYQNVNNVKFATFNSGAAKYARVSCGSTTDMYLCKGTTVPSAFAPYEIEYCTDMTVEKYKDGSIPHDALDQDVINSIVNADGINLYDAQAAVVGILQSNGQLNPTSTDYITSDYIPIKQGFTYTISPRCRYKCFYSGESEADFVSRDSTEHTEPHSFIAEITGFLKFSVINTASNVACVETYTGDVTKKIEEGISLSEYQKEQVSALIESTANLGHDVLYGKKWAVCGDSFTNSGGTGSVMPDGTKYAGNPYTYPWIIGSRQNMDIVKFFEGGRTLAFPEEPGTFANSLTNPNATWYYQNIPADADYITIYLGINDEHHSSESSGGDGEDNTGIIPIGTIDDTTTATYLGAWNVVLTWLITNRPNAHIGIIVTNGIANKDQYRLGQIAIAEKYGIPYIDMNGDARTPAMLRTSNPNIPANIKQALIEKWSANYPSNQHPNDAAQLFESSFIENFLRRI